VGDEARGRRSLGGKVAYVYDPRFDRPDAGARFLAPTPADAPGEGAGTSPPAGLSPDAASLHGIATPLRPEDEVHLFLKMNYLKHLAGTLREALDPATATGADLGEIERVEAEARGVRDRIVRANLGLVVSLARGREGPGRGFDERLSDGNLSLIRAVDKFDVSRGFKFSTYASCAILRSLARAAGDEGRRRHRFVTGHEMSSGVAPGPRDDSQGLDGDRCETRESVRQLLGRLGDREREVIAARFGLGRDRAKTLRQIGEEMEVTRERVRQIESRALEKLRGFAREQGLDPTAA
jgi:RNA polymerase primary sigma factor